MNRDLVTEFKEAQAEANKRGHEVVYETGDGRNVQYGKCKRCGGTLTIGYPNVNECQHTCVGPTTHSQR